MSAPSFHISSKSFYKAQYGLVDGVLWQIIPYCLQDFLQLVDGIWPPCTVVLRVHCSADARVDQLQAPTSGVARDFIRGGGKSWALGYESFSVGSSGESPVGVR